ncbi:hypothetical protein KCU64_g1623, partial [Aureobasidium melanogenum]
MSTYHVITQEKSEDRRYLLTNHYNLAIAKSIVTGNTTVCNTIYQGSLVGPRMVVSWEEIFGVNFSLDVPTSGAKVSVSGDWQALQLGDGYKLDDGGGWVANSDDPSNQPHFLNVLNKYNANVHIIIGTQSQASGEWSPIFISESALVMSGYGAYQPSEEVQLWYGNEQNPGYIIATQQTPVKTYMYRSTDPHYFHYDTVTGVWHDQSTPYNPANVRDELGSPIPKLVVFTTAVTAMSKFITKLHFHMDAKGWEVSVAAKTPANLEFSVLISKKNKDDNEGSPEPLSDLDSALRECVGDGALPHKESWKIH